ncbi:hypothetical protein [Vibrio sp. 1CM24A]|uniref:hypothetical protein n=1 Tax=Vibrio sp. 1CM24A TaxID=2929165 RepID=UPI0020BE0102|nr:hypothetical protein [Vibrio sp. 1CM24A]MCK8083546.1 hypothetical protein [Vibrio sp. 1CM24A]
MLNRVKPNACVFCSDNPNNVIKSLVDETALHEFVDRLPGSNWRISRSIVDVKHNKVTYNNHVLHNLDGYLVVECKIHPHSKKKVQIRGSFRQEITSYSCRECGGNKCRRYTPKLINSQIATLGLPNTIIVDICKSGLKNELEKIAPQMHLYLKCSIHGEVSRPLTTYAITKKIKNSVNKGFCNRCSPSAGYYINPKRVRDYFESEERIRTYGAKYKALISDEVMQELFDDAIEQGKQPWLVPIPVLITPIGLSWHGGVMEPFKSSVSFAAFKKGSSKITHLRGGSCFLAKVFALLNHKYNLGFSNEVKFKGLLTNKANPIRVDFFNEHLGIAIEIDGAQHIELMPSVGTVKEQKKKLSSQRERDARVNDYFDRHSSYRLYRVPCYHKTQKSTRSLSKSEQFDSALSIAKKLHLLVHGSVLPVHEFNIDDLLYSYEDYCDRLDERHNILYTIYDKFSANIDSFFYNNGKLYYSVTCKNGHRHVYAYKTHYYHRDKKEFCKACKQLSKVSL